MGGLGIFAYLNYDTPRERQYVLSTLIVGLQRLEYRGYDSAGAQTHRERERDSWRFSRRAFSLAFLPRRA
jgi:glutamine---fructose-6-phosphate transaminase (isomerizing)